MGFREIEKITGRKSRTVGRKVEEDTGASPGVS